MFVLYTNIFQLLHLIQKGYTETITFQSFIQRTEK